MVVAESGLYFRSTPTGETDMLTGKFFKTVLTAAAILALTAPVQANLVARYLDANIGVDAYYDTDLNITWLRDANARGNGVMNRDRATSMSWAATYTLGGVTGWRLPVAPVCDGNVNCAGSEWGHLWYSELGNMAYDPNNPSTTGFQNKGDFVNWQLNIAGNAIYWSSSTGTYQGNTFYSVFLPFSGRQDGSVDNQYYAMAVHDGSVGRTTENIDPPGNSVPEPESMLLALTALGALALARRQRHGRGF
jgi:MYXO-CTERM domain-containing protein